MKRLNRIDIYKEIEKEQGYSLEDIAEICDAFTSLLGEVFIKEQSVELNGLPDIKVKRSKANQNIGSPKTPRKDRILVSMKISLEEKRSVQHDKNKN